MPRSGTCCKDLYAVRRIYIGLRRQIILEHFPSPFSRDCVSHHLVYAARGSSHSPVILSFLSPTSHGITMGESSPTLSFFDLDELTLEEQLQLAVFNCTTRKSDKLTHDNLRRQDPGQRRSWASKG